MVYYKYARGAKKYYRKKNSGRTRYSKKKYSSKRKSRVGKVPKVDTKKSLQWQQNMGQASRAQHVGVAIIRRNMPSRLLDDAKRKAQTHIYRGSSKAVYFISRPVTGTFTQGAINFDHAWTANKIFRTLIGAHDMLTAMVGTNAIPNINTAFNTSPATKLACATWLKLYAEYSHVRLRKCTVMVWCTTPMVGSIEIGFGSDVKLQNSLRYRSDYETTRVVNNGKKQGWIGFDFLPPAIKGLTSWLPLYQFANTVYVGHGVGSDVDPPIDITTYDWFTIKGSLANPGKANPVFEGKTADWGEIRNAHNLYYEFQWEYMKIGDDTAFETITFAQITSDGEIHTDTPLTKETALTAKLQSLSSDYGFTPEEIEHLKTLPIDERVIFIHKRKCEIEDKMIIERKERPLQEPQSLISTTSSRAGN